MAKMKTKYEYIHFDKMESPPRAKTSYWMCVNNNYGTNLGIIKWYGGWRQYCFFPYDGMVFNTGCLADISHFIGQLMDERKVDKRE